MLKAVCAARQRPREHALGIGENGMRGGRVAAIDDRIKQVDDVGAGNGAGRLVGPNRQQLAADQQLDVARRLFARGMALDEFLGERAKGDGFGLGLRALARVDAGGEIAQHLARLLSRLD